jgi:MbtH protein
MDANCFDDPEGGFAVLINDQGQYSLWPSFAVVPAGWSVALAETDRRSAVDFIERNWTDMRPKSLVKAMEPEV